MRTQLITCLGLFVLLQVAAHPTPPEKNERQSRLTAPTYYIAARVRDHGPGWAEILGVTNLPKGSMVTARIADFYQDGWKDYSVEFPTAVNGEGFFRVTVHPKEGLSFQRNLVAIVDFMPYRPVQPAEVLSVVGERGQLLGDFDNPQMLTVSGNNHVLETIARM